MKKLMMLLIAMINIFAFTSCNNEVADGTDDIPEPEKDLFELSINDAQKMIEGKCFKANENGFTVHLNNDNGEVEAVNYQNFSITFKKNSILILKDDNDLNNSIELNNIKYIDQYVDSKETEHSGTYIEYKYDDEKYYIQLAFFGRKDNFCLGVIFGSGKFNEIVGFFTGSLNCLYEVPIERGNETDVLFSDIHKNYLNNTPTEENINAISDAYILMEMHGGDDKNMYQYYIYKIDTDKNVVTMYALLDEVRANKMLEWGSKIVKTINNCSWIAPVEMDEIPFSELLKDDGGIADISSYCIIDKTLYEKYSDILPTGLF